MEWHVIILPPGMQLATETGLFSFVWQCAAEVGRIVWHCVTCSLIFQQLPFRMQCFSNGTGWFASPAPKTLHSLTPLTCSGHQALTRSKLQGNVATWHTAFIITSKHSDRSLTAFPTVRFDLIAPTFYAKMPLDNSDLFFLGHWKRRGWWSWKFLYLFAKFVQVTHCVISSMDAIPVWMFWKLFVVVYSCLVLIWAWCCYHAVEVAGIFQYATDTKARWFTDEACVLWLWTRHTGRQSHSANVLTISHTRIRVEYFTDLLWAEDVKRYRHTTSANIKQKTKLFTFCGLQKFTHWWSWSIEGSEK